MPVNQVLRSSLTTSERRTDRALAVHVCRSSKHAGTSRFMGNPKGDRMPVRVIGVVGEARWQQSTQSCLILVQRETERHGGGQTSGDPTMRTRVRVRSGRENVRRRRSKGL